MSTNVEQAAVFPVTHRPGLPFPDVPRFQGWIRPTRIEGDIFDLEVVQGSVPRELNGRFYTMAADTQFSPRLGDDVFFNGDGMIRMFTIADGHVDYRSRYVMTEKLRAERSARRALFGAYRNPFTDDPSVAGVNRGNANTAFVFSGGKLLTLKEDARPVAVDPVTLETQGEWAFNGKLTSKTFTAHPKVDQRTGEMFFFGYEAKGLATRDIAYYIAGPDGEITHEAWLEAPYVGFMHDFVVSDDYVIFTVFPATADLDRLKAGGQHWRWDPKCNTYLGVMPRRGTAADVRWFTGPPRWAYHFFNSSNDGTAITIDACVGEAISAPCFYPDTYGKPIDPPKTVTRITRWTLDYNNPDAGFQEHILDNNYADYPSVDPRKQTTRHRVGFAAIVHPHDGELDLDSSDSNLRAMGLNAVIRYDFVENRVVSRFVPGRQSSIQEPLFIPRGPDAPEGDGWLIMLVDRWNTMLNDLVIVDTADLAAGPVATVSLPMRLPTGVHTLWLDDAELTKASR